MQASVAFEEIQCQIILKFIFKNLNYYLKRRTNIILPGEKASVPHE